MHVFVVLAVALILAGLMRLEQEPQRADRHLRWIQLGLLISLLSKPVVALMLPVLFVLPETRRKLLLPVAVYAVLSLLFLLVPRLNPGGYNGIHWLYIPDAVVQGPIGGGRWCTRSRWISRTIARDSLLADAPERGGRRQDRLAGSRSCRLAAVALMSLAPLILPERGQRIRAAIVAASLCVLSLQSDLFPGLGVPLRDVAAAAAGDALALAA